MNKQITLSALTDELARAKTHKKDFLLQIGRIVPWGEWIRMIEPRYYYSGIEKSEEMRERFFRPARSWNEA